MTSFEEKLDAAVRDKLVSGAILYAKDKSGKLNYSKIVGSSDPAAEGGSSPLRPDTVLMIASCTKLITTVALLQLVERGLVGLDDNVEPHVPELARQPILTGFTDDGQPITSPNRTGTVTLRRLLTHSAGTGYDFKEESLMRFQAAKAAPFVSGGVAERYDYPFLYDPGTGWAYSSSIDWAGIVLEKITGRKLDEYLRDNIFRPLGLKSFTFWLDKDQEIAGRLWKMAARDPQTGLVGLDTSGFSPNNGLTECFGGQGLYGTVPEYVEVLRSLLVDDERLLKKETAAMMFRPQLEPAPKAALLKEFHGTSYYVGYYPDTGGEYDWGLGGVVVDGDSHPWRKRGFLTWGGGSNVAWWIDRESGICGVYGSQLTPPADKTNQAFVAAFEKEMYDRLAKLKAE